MRAAILFAMLTTTLAYAGDMTPRQTVFDQECKQVDAQALGFSCHYQPGQFVLQMHEPFSKMEPERRDRAQYEFDKISLRFFELGGKTFEVKADFWEPNKKRGCARRKGKAYHSFYCFDY